MKKLLFLLLLTPMFFIGCKEEQPEEQETLITDIELQEYASVYCNDSIIIPIKANADYTLEYNPIHISATKGQNNIKIKGIIIGSTDLIIKSNSQSKSCKIDVRGIYNVYKEPLFFFGEIGNYIMNYETRTLLRADEGMLLYEGENSNIYRCIYMLENSYLKSCITTHSLTSVNVPKQLAERYVPITYQDGIYLFASPNGEMGVAVEITADGVVILYMPTPNTSKSTNDLIMQSKKILDKYKNIHYDNNPTPNIIRFL